MHSSRQMWTLALVLLPVAVQAFSMKNFSPDSGTVAVKEGEAFELHCNVDNWWEWCTFKQGGNKICDFRWKKDVYNVTVLECDDFDGRFEFIADYNNYECGVRIFDAQPDDAGKWSCSLEEYYGYTRNYGKVVRQQFKVDVELATTTTTTTTTTVTTPEMSSSYSSSEGTTADQTTSFNSRFGSSNKDSLYADPNSPDSPIIVNRSQSLFSLLIITVCIIVLSFTTILLILGAMHSRQLLPPRCDQLTVQLLSIMTCGFITTNLATSVKKTVDDVEAETEAATDIKMVDSSTKDGEEASCKHGTIVRSGHNAESEALIKQDTMNETTVTTTDEV